MGLMLAIVLLLNMLGALFIIPSFIMFFKPKFITGRPARAVVNRIEKQLREPASDAN
jgi:hypothetical protein